MEKYRAWDKKNKQWLEYTNGFAVNFNGILVCPSYDKELLPVSKDVILIQYTGLKDKNGKEIYEGDICKVDYLKDKYVGQVEYKNGGFWIVKNNGYGGEGYFLSDIYDDTNTTQGIIEIIGTIYENPKLLNN